MNKLKCLVCVCLLVSSGQIMAADHAMIEQLVQTARSMGLSSEPGWLRLLHYRQHVFGGFYSQADDVAFFVARDGKHDPQAELEASLRAFFNEHDGLSAQCRFPARLYWLDKRLSFKQQLPAVHCQQFSDWQQSLQAEAVTLVFPAMYLNNPASMFGHSFLRLDRADTSPLLSYTLSYAAQHDATDSALVYVYRGLSGGYSGKFSVQPYYETVQSYGDIEHRDIWEYSLQLNQQQVDQLVRHAWEIKNIHFDYYFLRENCSYRLLSLLEVARDQVAQNNHHPVYAIPVDTVRTIEQQQIISAASYRPSISSRLEQMFRQLSIEQRQWALALLQQQQAPQDMHQYSALQQAQIIDFMIEFSAYGSSINDELSRQLLLLRSQLAVSQQETFKYTSDDPLNGHPSARWQIGLGNNQNLDYYSLGMRFAFHDLLDRPNGFVPGTAISILDTHLRYYENHELRIDRLEFFRVQSLNRVTEWHTPMSAEFEFSMQHDVLRNDNVYTLSAALGYTGGGRSGLLYAMLQAMTDNYATQRASGSVYAGVKLGALWWISANSRLNLEVQSSRDINDADNDLQFYSLQYQYDVDVANAIRLQAFYRERMRSDNDGIELSFVRYF